MSVEESLIEMSKMCRYSNVMKSSFWTFRTSYNIN